MIFFHFHGALVRYTNINALSNVTLSWRVTKGRVAIPSEKRDRQLVTLLAMTQELIGSQ
jgi:hypothetical protein